jgi:hypothetical protein
MGCAGGVVTPTATGSYRTKVSLPEGRTGANVATPGATLVMACVWMFI